MTSGVRTLSTTITNVCFLESLMNSHCYSTVFFRVSPIGTAWWRKANMMSWSNSRRISDFFIFFTLKCPRQLIWSAKLAKIVMDIGLHLVMNMRKKFWGFDKNRDRNDAFCHENPSTAQSSTWSWRGYRKKTFFLKNEFFSLKVVQNMTKWHKKTI